MPDREQLPHCRVGVHVDVLPRHLKQAVVEHRTHQSIGLLFQSGCVLLHVFFDFLGPEISSGASVGVGRIGEGPDQGSLSSKRHL